MIKKSVHMTTNHLRKSRLSKLITSISQTMDNVV